MEHKTWKLTWNVYKNHDLYCYQDFYILQDSQHSFSKLKKTPNNQSANLLS